MNRAPRRPSRLQPPLRGRMAAASPLEQKESKPLVRQRPPISGSLNVRNYQNPICNKIPASWLDLYKKWPGLFKLFDHPWKLIVALILLVILSMLIGSLLL